MQTHFKNEEFIVKKSGMRNIEVCCTSVEDALQAAEGGAVRIELCSALGGGGVTPSAGLILSVVKSVAGALDVNVLIRPNDGAFNYSPSEIRVILEDIGFCRRAGVSGVVVGALTPDGDIDIEACRAMVNAASGMKLTFHRAFDVCPDPSGALEQIAGLGFDHILTSGQRAKAIDGAALIGELVEQASGRLVVMPGSGVNPSNIAEIERLTGASEFHSTARKPVPEICRRHVPELGFDEPSAGPGLVLRTSADVVRELIDAQ